MRQVSACDATSGRRAAADAAGAATGEGAAAASRTAKQKITTLKLPTAVRMRLLAERRDVMRVHQLIERR